MRTLKLETDGRAEIETPDGWVTVTRSQGRTEISIRRNPSSSVGLVIRPEGEKVECLFDVPRRSLEICIRPYESIQAGQLIDEPGLHQTIFGKTVMM